MLTRIKVQCLESLWAGPFDGYFCSFPIFVADAGDASDSHDGIFEIVFGSPQF